MRPPPPIIAVRSANNDPAPAAPPPPAALTPPTPPPTPPNSGRLGRSPACGFSKVRPDAAPSAGAVLAAVAPVPSPPATKSPPTSSPPTCRRLVGGSGRDVGTPWADSLSTWAVAAGAAVVVVGSPPPLVAPVVGPRRPCHGAASRRGFGCIFVAKGMLCRCAHTLQVNTSCAARHLDVGLAPAPARVRLTTRPMWQSIPGRMGTPQLGHTPRVTSLGSVAPSAVTMRPN